jgi:hypothetical protein
MSGGRATRAQGDVRQAGDITAVDPEGHSLTSRFYIECKFYKDLKVELFVLDGGGPLGVFWRKTREEAARYGRTPMLIAKQNNGYVLVVAPGGAGFKWTPGIVDVRVKPDPDYVFCIWKLDEIVRTTYPFSSTRHRIERVARIKR